MKIKSFVFNSFYENTYVLSSASHEAYIIDPGCYEKRELDEVISYLSQEKLTPKAILNTHCHIDHVLGNSALKKHYSIPLWIPENEKEIFNAVEDYAPQWGIVAYNHCLPDEYLAEGSSLTLNEIEINILEVPGHSPGHLMFYLSSEKVLIGGDVLFRESIGRTDLPGGNHEALITNIKEKVYTLPDDTTVWPGHGPSTTVGFEKKNNPFVVA